MEWVRPNLHVALVHAPIGLLLVGAILELFARRTSSLKLAGRWMILIGALSGLPVALSGVYALRDVMAGELGHDAFDGWLDLRARGAIPADSAAYGVLSRHLWLQVFGTGGALLASLLWIASSDAWRRSLRLGLTLLMLAGVACTLIGSHLGGDAVYSHGVGVSATQPDEHHPDATPTLPATKPAAARSPGEMILRAGEQVDARVPLMQTHVILAGTSVALSLLAIAVGIRRRGELENTYLGDVPTTLEQRRIAAVFSQGQLEPDIDAPWSAPAPAVLAVATTTSPVKWFFLAGVVALLTALGGAWLLAVDTGQTHPQRLWEIITDARQNTQSIGGVVLTRRLLHIVAGTGVVIVPILLALLVRVAPRARLSYALFTVLLLLLIAAQVWLGVLLLLDNNVGPLHQWKPLTS